MPNNNANGKQRNVIDFMNMDNITGNNLSTNDFLGIDELIREARERSERIETANWSGSIKYMLWNATGMMPNLDRIVRRMETEDILFGFIVETWLHPGRAIPKVCRDTSAVCVVHPVGFERGKNGISLIINPQMKKHPLLKDLQILARDTVNGTYIYLQVGNIKVLCVYFPPSQPEEIDTWIEEVLLKCRANTADEIIILGDFNARRRDWGDHSENSKGGILERWIESNGLERVDTGRSPTYVTTRGNSIIDHVFTNVPGVTGITSDPVTNVAGHVRVKISYLKLMQSRSSLKNVKRMMAALQLQCMSTLAKVSIICVKNWGNKNKIKKHRI
jgi:hypothetical protein